MQQRRLVRVATAALTIGLLAAGCSSGGSEDSSTSAKRAGSTTTTVPKFDSAGAAGLCPKLAEIQGKGDELDADPAATPAQRQQKWNALVESIDTVAKKAPTAIRPDLILAAKFYAAFRTTVSKYGYDRSKVPQSELDALASKSVREAAARVTAYQNQLCNTATTTTTAG